MDRLYQPPFVIDSSLPHGTCRLVRHASTIVVTVDSVDTAQALLLAVNDWTRAGIDLNNAQARRAAV